MNKLTKIEKIKWNNEVVITTELLAETYGTSINTIHKAYNRNKKRFVKNKHYYHLTAEALKNECLTNRQSVKLKPRTANLFLWTERGASRLSKILDTDRAWQQFDVLEETYFKVQEFKKLISESEHQRLLESDKLKSLKIADLSNQIERFNIDEAYEKYYKPNRNGHLRTKAVSYFRGEKEQSFSKFIDELGLFKEFKGEFRSHS